jgi:mRNA interferase MazF
MVTQYIPDRGDLVWLEFDPQTGHEQKGLRPALVLTPASYNKLKNLAIFCPITNQEKGYPFEVKLPQDCSIKGVILSDHVKSLDWNERSAKLICKTSQEIINDVVNNINKLIWV